MTKKEGSNTMRQGYVPFARCVQGPSPSVGKELSPHAAYIRPSRPGEFPSDDTGDSKYVAFSKDGQLCIIASNLELAFETIREMGGAPYYAH